MDRSKACNTFEMWSGRFQSGGLRKWLPILSYCKHGEFSDPSVLFELNYEIKERGNKIYIYITTKMGDLCVIMLSRHNIYSCIIGLAAEKSRNNFLQSRENISLKFSDAL